MKKKVFPVFCFFLFNLSVLAQNYEPVTVRAGMKIVDVIPFSERYRYPEFTPGRIQLKTGVYSDTRLDYNFLNQEMEYIRNRDTLAIANAREIEYISVAQDTFYYDKGYFEIVSGGPVKVVLKQYIKVKEAQKQDSYGSTSSGAAITSYGSLPQNGNFYKLTANTDLMMQRTLEYYFSKTKSDFTPFTRKNAMRMFPGKEKQIKAYLKSNRVNFNTREDLLRFAGYLGTLK
jgi:hypothetical protein